jgi:energy-coupling factor transport system permease protein
VTVAEPTSPERPGSERPGSERTGSDSSAPGEEGSRRAHRPRSFVLLRKVDVDSPIHRLWAGTKLIGAVGVSLTVSLVPTWPAIGVIVALLLGAGLIAHIPRSAVPRPPIWFWLVVFGGGLLTVFSGGKPELVVGGAHIGLGDLDSYVKFTLVSVVLLGAGALIGWTTSLGDIGPAVGRLLRPLRALRVPAEEWATAIALCIRSLPILVEEVRTLIAARRLRPKPAARQGALGGLDEAGDLLVAALAVSLRRAAEMAEAMTARGGTGSITARAPGPKRRDMIALGVIAGACSAAWLLPN